MTKICLVRHGETDWNVEGILQGQRQVPLNQTGRKQAHATGKHLAQSKTPFHAIITSSLNRATETAAIINQYLQLPLKENAAFMERFFGEVEGMRPEEREELFKSRPFPGQEPEKDFHERVIHGFEKLTAEYEEKHVLLISHGLVIQLILDFLQEKTIDYQENTLLNGCISHISLQNKQWRVDTFNQTAHLK